VHSKLPILTDTGGEKNAWERLPGPSLPHHPGSLASHHAGSHGARKGTRCALLFPNSRGLVRR